MLSYGVSNIFFSTQVPGNDDRNTLNALWGKLGSEILMQNWETALEDLNRLKDVIESNVSFLTPNPLLSNSLCHVQNLPIGLLMLLLLLFVYRLLFS